MKKLIAFVLAVVMVCSAGISCTAEQELLGYGYDNSLLITVVLSGKTPADVFTSEMKVCALIITYKEALGQNTYKYQVIAMILGPSEKVIDTISAVEGVQSVEKNYYAVNWFECALGVKFSDSHLYVPLGKTRDLTYTVNEGVVNSRLRPHAVEITVDPTVFDIAAADEQTLRQMAIPNLFPAEGNFVFSGDYPKKQFSYDGFLGIRNGTSESNRYVIILETFLYGLTDPLALDDFVDEYSLDYPCYINAICNIKGVESAQLLYEVDVSVPNYVTEKWGVTYGPVASITLSGGKPARGDGNPERYEQTATIKGLECGYSSGVLTREGMEFTFFVEVYREGDVNEDDKVTATDALMALQNAVGLREFSELQTYAADMNGDRKIEAGDALKILIAVVGKAV